MSCVTTARVYLQLFRLFEVLVGLLVDGLDVVEQREVLVLLLDEDRHQPVQVVDVGHRLELLECLLVPLCRWSFIAIPVVFYFEIS